MNVDNLPEETTDSPPEGQPAPLLVLRAFGVLVAFIAAQAVGGLIFAAVVKPFVGHDLDLLDLTTVPGIVVILCAEIVVLATMVLLAWILARSGQSGAIRQQLGFAVPRRAAASLIACLPVLIVMLGPSMVASVGSDFIAPSLSNTRLILLIVLAVTIGVTEEITFRGVMLLRLDPVRRPGLTIVATTVLFGAPHLFATQNFAGVAVNAAAAALAVGVPFACVRLRHGTLWGPIWAHAAIDTWAFAHTGAVTVNEKPTLASSFVFLGLAAALAAGYVAWWYRGCRISSTCVRVSDGV